MSVIERHPQAAEDNQLDRMLGYFRGFGVLASETINQIRELFAEVPNDSKAFAAVRLTFETWFQDNLEQNQTVLIKEITVTLREALNAA